MITADRLRELLHYDPATGIFVRLVAPRFKKIPVGSVAGYLNYKGQRVIKIDGKHYFANRLAWLYMNGEWPPKWVDHRNLNPDDNRWDNLRCATALQNNANRRRCGALPKGVYFEKRTGKYGAQIRQGGRRRHLGTFLSAEEAHAAYWAAAQRTHGEFARAA